MTPPGIPFPSLTQQLLTGLERPECLKHTLGQIPLPTGPAFHDTGAECAEEGLRDIPPHTWNHGAPTRSSVKHVIRQFPDQLARALDQVSGHGENFKEPSNSGNPEQNTVPSSFTKALSPLL